MDLGDESTYRLAWASLNPRTEVPVAQATMSHVP